MSELWALSIQELSKSYGDKTVVNNISLNVKRGEIFALLGPNGAGKSTTLHMIVGLCKIMSGKIFILGQDNQQYPYDTRARIGMMHQEIVVDNFFPVESAVKTYAGYYGKKVEQDWCDHILNRLDLYDHRKKKPIELSGGMKRRLMFAKALVHRPDILILDEPTAGVDVELRYALWDFVCEINQESNCTILLTTHYLEEAEKLCRRAAIMSEGEIRAVGDISELKRDHSAKSFEDLFLGLTRKKTWVTKGA